MGGRAQAARVGVYKSQVKQVVVLCLCCAWSLPVFACVCVCSVRGTAQAQHFSLASQSEGSDATISNLENSRPIFRSWQMCISHITRIAVHAHPASSWELSSPSNGGGEEGSVIHRCVSHSTCRGA